MTFLNPALLLGLIASFIPILIHLFNRRKLEKINFSSIAFLKELQKTKIKKIKLKQWILLILRTLIIALLVLAFSRPAIKLESFGGNSSAKTTGALVIDDSPSMKIVKGKGSYYSVGINIAGKIIDLYQPGDIVYLIFSSNPQKYYKFNSGLSAYNFLREEKVKNIRGNLTKAIARGIELLNSSVNINKELFVISDLQKNNVEILSDEEKTIRESKNISTYWVDLKPTTIANISLDKLTTENQIFELGKEVSVNIKLHSNYSNAESVLSLFVNGSRSAQKKVKLNGTGSINEKLFFTLKQTGALKIKATIEEDAFNYDNSLFSSVIVPDKVHIAVVFNNSNETKFLKYALQPMEGKTILVNYINSLKFVYENLNRYDVLLIAGFNKNIDAGKIKSFINEGKGVMIFPGEDVNLTAINNLFANLGVKAKAKFINNPKGLSINRIDKTELAHPLFKGLFREDDIKISSPEIFKYIQLSKIEGLRSLIILADGTPFLFETGNTKRVLFINTTANLYWSTFPLNGLFAPLIYRSIFYLATGDANGNTYLTGDKIPIKINGSRIPLLKVETPSNRIEKTDLTNLKSATYYYSQTNDPGVYYFYSGKKLINASAVNHDPTESELSYENTREYAQAFSKLNPEIKTEILSDTDNIEEIIERTRFGIELWKYLLITALLLALIEMLVARNTKKEMVSLNNV